MILRSLFPGKNRLTEANQSSSSLGCSHLITSDDLSNKPSKNGGTCGINNNKGDANGASAGAIQDSTESWSLGGTVKKIIDGLFPTVGDMSASAKKSDELSTTTDEESHGKDVAMRTGALVEDSYGKDVVMKAGAVVEESYGQDVAMKTGATVEESHGKNVAMKTGATVEESHGQDVAMKTGAVVEESLGKDVAMKTGAIVEESHGQDVVMKTGAVVEERRGKDVAVMKTGAVVE